MDSTTALPESLGMFIRSATFSISFAIIPELEDSEYFNHSNKSYLSVNSLNDEIPNEENSLICFSSSDEGFVE